MQVFSSSDHQAAGAHDGAEVLQLFVVAGRGPGAASGMQPPEGPPICTALHFLPLGMPPPTPKTTLADGGAHRDFHQAGAPHHAGQGEHLGALAARRCPWRRTPRRRICMMVGTLAKVSTLLMTVGLPNRPGLDGIGRTGPRHAALAFDAVHQGGFLAADEGAGAHLDDDVEVEAAAQDVLAQQAVFLGLGDGGLQVLDGQRVLGADVDVGLGGADGVAAGDHAFQQPVRIALADRAIHERARIAFVGVADHVLLVAGRVEGHLPLLAGGEAAAAAAAQAAGQHLVHHFLAGLAVEELEAARSSRPGRCTRRWS